MLSANPVNVTITSFHCLIFYDNRFCTYIKDVIWLHTDYTAMLLALLWSVMVTPCKVKTFAVKKTHASTSLIHTTVNQTYFPRWVIIIDSLNLYVWQFLHIICRSYGFLISTFGCLFWETLLPWHLFVLHI